MVDTIKYSHSCKNVENVYSIYHTEDTDNTISCDECGVKLYYHITFLDKQEKTYPSFDGTIYDYTITCPNCGSNYDTDSDNYAYLWHEEGNCATKPDNYKELCYTCGDFFEDSGYCHCDVIFAPNKEKHE